jgi:hypothetical protein
MFVYSYLFPLRNAKIARIAIGAEPQALRHEWLQPGRMPRMDIKKLGKIEGVGAGEAKGKKVSWEYSCM